MDFLQCTTNTRMMFHTVILFVHIPFVFYNPICLYEFMQLIHRQPKQCRILKIVLNEAKPLVNLLRRIKLVMAAMLDSVFSVHGYPRDDILGVPVSAVFLQAIQLFWGGICVLWCCPCRAVGNTDFRYLW